ncbi:pimeloyl-ACP methyl ester carboxylesterase [Crossiella equi]|uniref:Pimeloyl-ACP methyl ester carboxylesterase n=1 Tax=Crossiella equi TaxID=130796 RepID=A0ABS5A8C1_9PSEU|nr:alpha/beta hydrolase [Crossiella equi]MBP2472844.1 pimeloyl-ACP methyl ester carboxylesterase [Crossiella equi]
MAVVEANGIRLHVQRMAAKNTTAATPPTVVFIHGIGTDSLASFYFTLAGPVAGAGHEVLAYDLRGHGRSERTESGYRVSDSVADLVALLDQQEITGPVHLVGNSYGGTVAFSFAAAHPERTASLVVIESEPTSENWSVKMADLLGRARAQLQHEEALAWITENKGGHTSKLAKAAGRMMAATGIADELPTGPILTAEQVAGITAPVLAVFGSESDLVAQAPVLAAALPHCRTVIVPGQEHSVLVEAPKVMRELLLEWLAEQGARVVA